MIYKAIYSICFSLTFLAPAAAQALTLCGKSAQGEGKSHPGGAEVF